MKTEDPSWAVKLRAVKLGMVERKLEVNWIPGARRNTVLVSCGCHYKLPVTEWLNTAEIDSLTVLEARRLPFHEVLCGQAAPYLLYLHCLEYVACKVVGVGEDRDGAGTATLFFFFFYRLFILFYYYVKYLQSFKIQSAKQNTFK